MSCYELLIKIVFTVNCAPGSYLSSSTCTPCEFDHFQDQQGQTSCKPCPTGSRTNDIGTRTPEECMLKGMWLIVNVLQCIHWCYQLTLIPSIQCCTLVYSLKYCTE